MVVVVGGCTLLGWCERRVLGRERAVGRCAQFDVWVGGVGFLEVE